MNFNELGKEQYLNPELFIFCLQNNPGDFLLIKRDFLTDVQRYILKKSPLPSEVLCIMVNESRIPASYCLNRMNWSKARLKSWLTEGGKGLSYRVPKAYTRKIPGKTFREGWTLMKLKGGSFSSLATLRILDASERSTLPVWQYVPHCMGFYPKIPIFMEVWRCTTR